MGSELRFALKFINIINSVTNLETVPYVASFATPFKSSCLDGNRMDEEPTRVGGRLSLLDKERNPILTITYPTNLRISFLTSLILTDTLKYSTLKYPTIAQCSVG